MKVGLVYQHALAAGGYPRDVRWLAGALRSCGIRADVISDPGPHADGLGDARVVPLEELRRVSAGYDVLHLWGLFLPRQVFAVARHVRSPLVISPIAHLMPKHIRRKWFKKLPYLAVVMPLLRRHRPLVHLFSNAERSNLVSALMPQALFEAGLGLFPPQELPRISAASEDYVLFLGRNDVQQKGIDLLIDAYAGAVREGVRYQLLLAGHAWADSRQRIAQMIARAGLGGRVHAVGPVAEEEKWALLRRARALAFLSRWDGPPRPVREALSVGTPVIVSPGTNMGAVVSRYDAGIEVELDGTSPVRALLQCGGEDWVRKRREGALRASRGLTWTSVAREYIRGYELAAGVAVG